MSFGRCELATTSRSRNLRVAVIGCGQIADAHVAEIRKLSRATLVAVCDQHHDLARQLAERFEVPGIFDNVEQMFVQARPDVVHITTPPHSHAPLAKAALAAGIHVYVEKPFTVTVAEADEVLAAADQAKRLVCVGHDQLFDPCWTEMWDSYKAGVIGSAVHVHSTMGYNLSGPFGRVIMGNPDHWIHRLPGGLFQNNLSHALYKVTEFLTDKNPRVFATWFGAESGGLPTELRVFLQGQSVTATILFSSRARPVERKVVTHGTKKTVEVDFEGRLLRWSRPISMPGPFAKIQVPWRNATEAGLSMLRNAWRFCRSDLQYFAGMNRLFGAFYNAIQNGTEPPIRAAEIRRVTYILDEIFRACRADETGAGHTADHVMSNKSE
jgi:predicted dehydrogenase